MYVQEHLFKSLIARFKESLAKEAKKHDKEASKPGESQQSNNNESNKENELRQSTNCELDSQPETTACAARQPPRLSVDQLKQIIIDEVTKLDERLLQQFQSVSDMSGSTGLFAIRTLADNKLLVANVGDSRAVLCNQRGSAIPLTTDHKPQMFKGMITRHD